MVYASPPVIRRNSHLVPAGLALFLLGLVAPLHLSLFGASWPLLWLPLAVVGLWPRQASCVPSALMLFVAGLWIDWVTLGAVGQWPLVFVGAYAIMRPDLADAGRGLVRGLSRCAGALLIGLIIFGLSGWFIYGVLPDIALLSRGVLVFAVSLPLLILLRDLIAGYAAQDDF